MGLRINPQTGQVEDDGQGVPIATPDQAQQVFQQGPPVPTPALNGPGTLAPQVQAAPAAQAPMERESQTQSLTRKIPRPEEAGIRKEQAGVDQRAIDIAGQEGDALENKAATDEESAQTKASTRADFTEQTAGVVSQDAEISRVAQAKYDAANEKLGKGEIKDFWADKSAAQKIGAALGLAMSGFGAALAGRGGGGGAFDVLEKIIDNDYRLQKAQIDLQERKVTAAREGIATADSNHARRMADLHVNQTAIWNQVGDEAAAKAAQSGTQQAAATAAGIKNLAEQKKVEHAQQAVESLRTSMTTTNTNVTGTGKNGGVDPLAVFDLNGNPVGQARRPDEAEKIRAGNAATVGLTKTLDEIKQFNSQHNWVDRKGPDASKQANALAARATGYITTMFQTGTLQISEFERYKEMLQPGMLQGASGANKTLDSIANGARESYNAKIQSQGIKLPSTSGGAQAPGGGGQQMSSQDAAAVSWARSHPGDPRAKEILQLHGL